MCLPSCPLCVTADVQLLKTDSRRGFYRCADCFLFFASPEQFPTSESERRVYESQRQITSEVDLQRLFSAVEDTLHPGSRVLDFGCGPHGTLAKMFTDAGHFVSTYDVFFDADMSVFESKYDLITATHVFEHLHDPRCELDRLWTCLNVGGTLAVLFKPVRDESTLWKISQNEDGSHVCYFNPATLAWLADHWEANLRVIEGDIVLFTKCC